ncbi:Exosome complex component RRP41 [Glycine soja]
MQRRVMEQRGGSPLSSCLTVASPQTTVTEMEGEFQPSKPTPVLVRTSTVGTNALLSTALLSLLLCFSFNASSFTLVSAFSSVTPFSFTVNPATFVDPRFSQVGPVGGIGDVKFGDAEGAEVKLREGGVVDEVEESGGDNEHKEEDEDEDAEGTAAYAAEVATLPFGLEGGGQHELSRRRWWRFGVGVPSLEPCGVVPASAAHTASVSQEHEVTRQHQLLMRQIRAEIGAVSKADGSAIFEMGNTKVIAAVYGPREVQNRSQQISSHALVRCEYSMANFSTGDRMRKSKGDRRSTEISLVIRQTMEACILTHLLPRSQIDIYVQVLQADGGTRSACINAATLALADAGIPMRDLVTSCSAGYLNSTPLLDLNYVEDSAGGPDVTLGILPKLDKVTLLQMDSKLPIDILENVMQLAIEGCKAIANYIREILLANTKQLEYRREFTKVFF